jgi:hypothetical protein
MDEVQGYAFGCCRIILREVRAQGENIVDRFGGPEEGHTPLGKRRSLRDSHEATHCLTRWWGMPLPWSRGDGAENAGDLANPDVEVQVGTKKVMARARTAEGEERLRLWKKALEFWPPYADYQLKTERQIPVVVLDPVR